MSLAALLGITRPLIVLDLETDGVVEGSRTIEIGHQVYLPSGTVREWRSLVNPERPIAAEATAVNHISDEMVRQCRACDRSHDAHIPPIGLSIPTRECEGFRPWPTFRQLAQQLSKGYSDCDFAGKNVRFDLGILVGEFKRVAVPWSYAGAFVIDADRLEAILEPRDLSSLYRRRLGKEPIDAHSALADVRMTSEIIIDQLEKGLDLPRSLAALHELQWPGFVDAEGKMRRGKDGVVRLQFGKHRGVAVGAIPSDYWRWASGADFSAEFKALAAECALGRFPS